MRRVFSKVRLRSGERGSGPMNWVARRKSDSMIFAKWFGRSVMATAILGILPLAGAGDANGVSDPGMLRGTIPSHTAKPSFMEVGIVRQWLVKPDDVVKKGQLLGREDTDLETLKLRSLRIQADSTAAIEAATADRDARKVEYENKQRSLAGGAPANRRFWRRNSISSRRKRCCATARRNGRSCSRTWTSRRG